MVLKTGQCATCSAEKVKLRTNPFSKVEECDACRKTGQEGIIGITDIKKNYGLKDEDLDGLQMVKEPKPAVFAGRGGRGGPDRRWYKFHEVEKRAPEVMKKREEEARMKEDERKAKENAKMAARLQKEKEEQEKKVAARDAEKAAKNNGKVAKGEGNKRKHEEKDAAKDEKLTKAPKTAEIPHKATSRGAARNAAAKKDPVNEESEEIAQKKKR